MMHEPDFEANEIQLVDFTTKELASFAKSHESHQFSYFAFDCNADYGEVLLCLDTPETSVAQAKESQARIAADVRKAEYADLNTVRHIHHTLEGLHGTGILTFGNNTGDFAFQGFAEILFDSWAEFSVSDDYAGNICDEWNEEDEGEDYRECKASVMFCRAIDKLVERGAFNCLRMTSPFLVGFGHHDGRQYVVRVLNW
jgi:hypothetical protein